MLKKIIILSIILIIALGYFIYPKIQELTIKQRINKANYCEVDSDCVDAGGKCPFGCWVYVNKNEVTKISELIYNFESNCVYDCVNCPTAVCLDKKCQEICN